MNEVKQQQQTANSPNIKAAKIICKENKRFEGKSYDF